MKIPDFHSLLTSLLLIFLLAGCNSLPGGKPTHPAVDRLAALPSDVEKGEPETDPHPPILHSSDYEPPVPIPGLVNTNGGEDSPFILPNGQVLYFFFTPDVRKPHQDQLVDGVTGIYVSYKQGENWGNPERVWLSNPGQLALDGAPALWGDELWFASVREGYGEIQFFTAQWIDGRWAKWEPVGDRLTKEIGIGEVHFDGDNLYFHADLPGGLGGLDIWKTTPQGNTWSDPVNIQAVNSDGSDGWPCLSPNGQELWLTRTYRGTPALFRSQKTGEGWSSPELILSQFAGEASVDQDGNVYFVHHYYREGEMIEADLYIMQKKK
jgi:hypothetical protein